MADVTIAGVPVAQLVQDLEGCVRDSRGMADRCRNSDPAKQLLLDHAARLEKLTAWVRDEAPAVIADAARFRRIEEERGSVEWDGEHDEHAAETGSWMVTDWYGDVVAEESDLRLAVDQLDAREEASRG